jgi:acyl dehydratase
MSHATALPDQKLTLKDLHVGQRFVSQTFTFGSEEIKQFAAQFDPQPFHLHEDTAAKTVFGGLVASGWHTLAVSMRLMVESITLECGLIGLGGTMSLLKPVRPGTTIHVESEITQIKPSRSKPGQAVVTMLCLVKNNSGDTVVELLPKLMVFGSKSA